MRKIIAYLYAEEKDLAEGKKYSFGRQKNHWSYISQQVYVQWRSLALLGAWTVHSEQQERRQGT